MKKHHLSLSVVIVLLLAGLGVFSYIRFSYDIDFGPAQDSHSSHNSRDSQSSQQATLNHPHTLTIETTSTPELRTLGLSGRESLPRDAALYFPMGFSDFHPIWMKDMRFPIDIMWLDSDGIVVDVREDARPESYPDIFRPRARAEAVLEVNAGLVAEWGIEPGMKMRFLSPTSVVFE